jgi:hypothetical protein
VRRHTSLIFRGQEVETDTTKIAAEVTWIQAMRRKSTRAPFSGHPAHYKAL